MNASLHDRAKEAFFEACLLPLSERDRFVARTCGSDEELRREVVSLLHYHDRPAGADSSLRVGRLSIAKPRFRRGAVLAGRYRVERYLGRGGMGEVYAAHDRVLGVIVALKIVHSYDDAQRLRLAGEVRLARQISHPGVCRIHDIGEHADELFLTMELIEGQDLQTRLARSGRLPSAEVAEIGVSLCEALAAAHQAGVLHLDLKPSNILIGRAGSVHITDFGIARSLTEGAPGPAREPLELFGTPAYMAPERGVASPSERTDLYSLGVVLYEIATGSLPFPATDPETLRDLQRSALPERPSHVVPGIDPLLEECLLRLLASDPALRPSSARVVGEELAAIRPLQQLAEAARGERRPITVLRCDLIAAANGGEPRPEPRPPGGHGRTAYDDSRAEEWNAVRARCAAICLRYGGTIAGHLDQGLLVHFDYPHAGERHADAAVRAGLRILEELRAGGPPAGSSRSVQAGVLIHTLSAVGSADPGQATTASGAMAFGEGLSSTAVTAGVVVSEATFRTLRDAYVTESVDDSQGAGVGDTRPAHRILCVPSPATGMAAPTRLTQYVGRSPQLALLERHWGQAVAGHGQVVIVYGEAGLGKTRFVHELERRVEAGARVLETGCVPADRSIPLRPFLDLLSHALGLTECADRSARADRLERALDALGTRLEPVLAGFSDWLLEPDNDAARPPRVPADADRKKQFIAALAEWICVLSETRPVLLVIEDLHWADSASLEAIEYLIQQVRTSSVLLLLTARPELRVKWSSRQIATVHLQPLDVAESQQLIAAGTQGPALSQEAIQNILGRGEGNPLFLEELLKQAVEVGPLTPGQGTDPALPLSLEGLLTARLDALGSAKLAAQAAAVCGRTFHYRLLETILKGDRLLQSIDLGASLDRLYDAEILFQRGTPPDAVLTFKHALFEEVAHATLAAGRRRRLHAAAARALPALDPELATSRPEVVAGHWSAAGARAEALSWWRTAGLRALERSAFAEAAHDFEHALAARRAVPDQDARRSLELELRLNLCIAETGRDGGMAPPGVVRSLRRVNALSSGLPEGDVLARALLLLSRLNTGLANRRGVVRLLSRLAALCDRVEDLYLAAAIHDHISVVLMLRGDFPASDRHYEACVRAYAQAKPKAPGPLAVDPLASVHMAASWRSWLRGHDAGSRSQLEAATSQADRLERDFNGAYVHLYATPPVLLRGDLATATRLVRRGSGQAETAGSQGLVDLGRALEACIAVALGETPGSVRRLSGALAALDLNNSFRFFRPVFLLYLAKAHELDGSDSLALTVLDEAAEHDRRRQDRLLLSEVRRRRGEVLARLGRGDEAEHAFRGALRAARRFGSVTLELRAVSSLARYQTAKGFQSTARRVVRATLDRLPGDVDVVEREEVQALAESLGVRVLRGGN